MPRLKFVNLSFNQLSTPLKQSDLEINVRWEYLRNLVLNSTLIDWESIQQILDFSPTLEELHLSLNEYDSVNLCNSDTECTCEEDTEAKDIENDNNCTCPKLDYRRKHKHLGIRKLHFNGNPVCKWKEIQKIGYAFPNLESLVLADCPINTLNSETEGHDEDNRKYARCESGYESEDSTGSPHDSFKHLKILNLNSTRLSSWDEIERLSKFPVLQCLRIQVGSVFVSSLIVFYFLSCKWKLLHLCLVFKTI